jgi:hypothetical protein
MNGSYVMVGRDSLKELADAPEDTLSFEEYASKIIQSRYTFNENIATNHYHAVVIRSTISPKIGILMPDIVDEMSAAFDDELRVGNGVAFNNLANIRLDLNGGI